jgi:hypothetical protein
VAEKRVRKARLNMPRLYPQTARRRCAVQPCDLLHDNGGGQQALANDLGYLEETCRLDIHGLGCPSTSSPKELGNLDLTSVLSPLKRGGRPSFDRSDRFAWALRRAQLEKLCSRAMVRCASLSAKVVPRIALLASPTKAWVKFPDSLAGVGFSRAPFRGLDASRNAGLCYHERQNELVVRIAIDLCRPRGGPVILLFEVRLAKLPRRMRVESIERDRRTIWVFDDEVYFGSDCKRRRVNDFEMVDQTGASWNQIAKWLHGIKALRDVA